MIILLMSSYTNTLKYYILISCKVNISRFNPKKSIYSSFPILAIKILRITDLFNFLAFNYHLKQSYSNNFLYTIFVVLSAILLNIRLLN